MTEYTTQEKDVWDLIAQKTLGSTEYLSDLVAANPEHRNVVIFGYGTVLNVPELPVQPTATEIPPWQR